MEPGHPSIIVSAALSICFSFLKSRPSQTCLLVVSDRDARDLFRRIASCTEADDVLKRLTIQFVPARSSRPAASRHCRRPPITPQTMEWLVFLEASNFKQHELIVLANFLAHLRRAPADNSIEQQPQQSWHSVGPYCLHRKESRKERQVLLSRLAAVTCERPVLII